MSETLSVRADPIALSLMITTKTTIDLFACCDGGSQYVDFSVIRLDKAEQSDHVPVDCIISPNIRGRPRRTVTVSIGLICGAIPIHSACKLSLTDYFRATPNEEVSEEV